MNGAVGARAIQRDTGAAVLVDYHSGARRRRGARGHSSCLRPWTLSCSSVVTGRQGARGHEAAVRRRSGQDRVRPRDEVDAHGGRGRPGTTLIVRPLDGQWVSSHDSTKAAAQKALKALKEALRTSGSKLDAGSGRSTSREVSGSSRATEWLEACREAGISKGTAGAVRKALGRAAKELREAGLLGEEGEFVWLNPHWSGGRRRTERRAWDRTGHSGAS